jgi:hypothetical protein
LAAAIRSKQVPDSQFGFSPSAFADISTENPLLFPSLFKTLRSLENEKYKYGTAHFPDWNVPT